MHTYLVTGGAGFIGANFVKYMLRKYADIRIVILDKLTYAGHLATIRAELADPRVTFVQGDIGNRELAVHLMQAHAIQYVVNFAAESHVDRSIANPQVFLETNILGTQTLLDAARTAWTVGRDAQGYPVYREGVKYLQISTDEVYGSLARDYEEPQPLELDREKLGRVVMNRTNLKTYGTAFFTEETPLSPRSPYSASKAGADLLVLAYADTYKLPVNITRCSNNYGPYHYPEKLIPLMIRHVLEGKPLPVYGAGKNVRDWLYVEDHAKAVDLVLHRGAAGEVYNVGGFNEEENIRIVRTIIDTIARIMREEPAYQAVLKTDLDRINDSLITHVQDRLGHDLRYAINPTKIAAELGWYPETPFEAGIERTIRWYLDNQDWVAEVCGAERS
jgi:dTDP-glucose 4,6-dehydratase